MYCTSALLPLWTGILQLLEVVVQGQGEVELIRHRVLHCGDVVFFKQARPGHNGSTLHQGSIRR